MLPALLVPATVVLLLWALYALGWESLPRASRAFAIATIAAVDIHSAPFVVQSHADHGGVLIGHGLDVTARSAEVARIDLASGAVTTTRVDDPFDRDRFAVYEEVPLNVGALSTRFRGILIPRPRLVLFNILGDGAPTISFDDALTGSERLVRTRGGETLLTRTLINGRDFERSRRAPLSAFQSSDGSLLVCLSSTTRGTTVWLFHNHTAKTPDR